MNLKGNNYKERINHQLKEWVKGNSIHNTIDGECCPDFSCCKPELLQQKEIRETFKEVFEKADKEEFNPDYHPYDDTKMGMLMNFMGNMLCNEYPEKKVHITDGNINHKKDLN